MTRITSTLPPQEIPPPGWMATLHSLSLGWQTDLIFAHFDGEIVDRGEYLVVRAPSNPTFWWGNFLLFHRAPQPGDLARWMAAFESEIVAAQPECRHRAFGIDAPARMVLPEDFAAAGFELNEATVLTLSAAQRPAVATPLPVAFEFSVLDLARDSSLVVDEQVAVDAGRYEVVGYREFAERQMARYAAMQAAGLGHWFGLFARFGDHRVLAASCGLFRDPTRTDSLGRFQYVSTHPDWRRRGLCKALVDAVCRYGFEQMGISTLAMVADPDDVAIGIYESLGFQRGFSTWQLERRPL